jgi:hypothetical protein
MASSKRGYAGVYMKRATMIASRKAQTATSTKTSVLEPVRASDVLVVVVLWATFSWLALLVVAEVVLARAVVAVDWSADGVVLSSLAAAGALVVGVVVSLAAATVVAVATVVGVVVGETTGMELVLVDVVELPTTVKFGPSILTSPHTTRVLYVPGAVLSRTVAVPEKLPAALLVKVAPATILSELVLAT